MSEDVHDSYPHYPKVIAAAVSFSPRASLVLGNALAVEQTLVGERPSHSTIPSQSRL